MGAKALSRSSLRQREGKAQTLPVAQEVQLHLVPHQVVLPDVLAQVAGVLAPEALAVDAQHDVAGPDPCRLDAAVYLLPLPERQRPGWQTKRLLLGLGQVGAEQGQRWDQPAQRR